MQQKDNNQNVFEKAAKVLYGPQTQKDKEEENLRNSLLKELGDKAQPKHVLYSSVDDLMKMKNEEDAKNLNIQNNNDKTNETPTGYAAPVSQKQNRTNSTPIEDLRSRQEYLERKMCKPDEKVIPGVNACSSNIEIKIDNRKMKPETYEKLRDFLGMKEGFRDTAYVPVKGDKLTIGYGHTKNVKPGDKITKEEAEKLFEEDMKEHIDSLKHVKVKLNENQKAALSSLIYNVGGTQFYNSNLLKKLNAKDFKGAADEFDTFNTKNGKVVEGLTNRRKQEKELFLTPDE